MSALGCQTQKLLRILGQLGIWATSVWEPLGRQGRSIALTHGLEFPRLSACGNGTARRSVVFLRSSKLSDEDPRSEWRLGVNCFAGASWNRWF